MLEGRKQLTGRTDNTDNSTRQQGSVTHHNTETPLLPPPPGPPQGPPLSIYADHQDSHSASSRFGSQGTAQRKSNSVTTLRRQVGRQASSTPNTMTYDYTLRCRAEIDTRADTVCVGATFLLHSTTGQIANVHGFHSNMKPIRNVPIGTVLTAVDLQDVGTIILTVSSHQLNYGTMASTLTSCQNNLVVIPSDFTTRKATFMYLSGYMVA